VEEEGREEEREGEKWVAAGADEDIREGGGRSKRGRKRRLKEERAEEKASGVGLPAMAALREQEK
jgi:hypothetical protein